MELLLENIRIENLKLKQRVLLFELTQSIYIYIKLHFFFFFLTFDLIKYVYTIFTNIMNIISYDCCCFKEEKV